MDEVIADSLGKRLGCYNRRFNRQLRRDQLEGHLEDAVPPDHVAALAEQERDPGFFADLACLPGSVDGVAALAHSHEIVIATAAMEVPTSFAAKFAWLRTHFPFIPPSQIVFCGDKSVLDVDYLIDDQPRHFERLRGTGVLFTAPHNRHERRYLRVDGWDDVRRLFLEQEGHALRQRAVGS